MRKYRDGEILKAHSLHTFISFGSFTSFFFRYFALYLKEKLNAAQYCSATLNQLYSFIRVNKKYLFVGGFVPREPSYFDPYHSTDLNLEIGTGVTVVPNTNLHQKNNGIYFQSIADMSN